MTGTACGMCLSPCLLQEGVEACPLPWSGIGSLIWSVEDGGLREKSHLVTYTELVPWWPQVGFAVEGIRGGSVKNQMYRGKK